MGSEGEKLRIVCNRAPKSSFRSPARVLTQDSIQDSVQDSVGESVSVSVHSRSAALTLSSQCDRALLRHCLLFRTLCEDLVGKNLRGAMLICLGCAGVGVSLALTTPRLRVALVTLSVTVAAVLFLVGARGGADSSSAKTCLLDSAAPSAVCLKTLQDMSSQLTLCGNFASLVYSPTVSDSTTWLMRALISLLNV